MSAINSGPAFIFLNKEIVKESPCHVEILVLASVNNHYLMLNCSSDARWQVARGVLGRQSHLHVKWHDCTIYNACHYGSWVDRIYFYLHFLHSKEL